MNFNSMNLILNLFLILGDYNKFKDYRQFQKHGLSNRNRLYVKTSKDTMMAIDDKIKENKSNQLVYNELKDENETETIIFNAIDQPRNSKQINNAKQSNKKKELIFKDEVMNVWYLTMSGLSHFIKEINFYPSLEIFLIHQGSLELTKRLFKKGKQTYFKKIISQTNTNLFFLIHTSKTNEEKDLLTL